ncbi:hypothetical protein GCM10023238_05380 [Streptomyces heliomycini]
MLYGREAYIADELQRTMLRPTVEPAARCTARVRVAGVRSSAAAETHGSARVLRYVRHPAAGDAGRAWGPAADVMGPGTLMHLARPGDHPGHR